jgi:hypothetical protein
MKRKIKDAIGYILHKQGTDTISAEKLLSIMFLADWKVAIEKQNHKTITQVPWYRTKHQLFSDEILDYIQECGDFIINKNNEEDEANWIVQLKENKVSLRNALTEQEIKAFDLICSMAENGKSPNYLVERSFPMIAYSYNNTFDLTEIAEEYVNHIRPSLHEAKEEQPKKRWWNCRQHATA